MADSEEKLLKIVNEVKYHSSKGNLEMNIKKTKFMLITRKPEKPIKIKLDNVSLERVHQFKKKTFVHKLQKMQDQKQSSITENKLLKPN